MAKTKLPAIAPPSDALRQNALRTVAEHAFMCSAEKCVKNADRPCRHAVPEIKENPAGPLFLLKRISRI
jgi:hypothetical protein